MDSFHYLDNSRAAPRELDPQSGRFQVSPGEMEIITVQITSSSNPDIFMTTISTTTVGLSHQLFFPNMIDTYPIN